ncbi:MAG: RNA polymerase sigma factor [Phenylobacterium sp.]|uniref:RNA polymerase sigma factor n=1 Tax=Phenylobacterium sp. TaxID=1871053 RepID=UPI0027315D66|nr:RNA polymerase sigma factor [Phenylobacterium sp.]MDP2011855.1 RNA polymerase sigma factor [Phenylobacterium sp.]
MDRDVGKVLDELLVAAARGGSRRAFNQIIVRWTPRLRRHAGRLLFSTDQAHDVVQDAWLGIARGLPRLDDPARFGGWAYAIVTRRCIDVMRRGSRDRRVAAEAASELLTHSAGVDGLARMDSRLDLASAIARLPIDQRLMISLHYGEGLSVEEIAAAHGLPGGTVKSRLHAARDYLRTLLEGEDDEQGR